MAEQFQVVAECVYATVTGPTGTAVQLLMKGAPFPAGDKMLDVYLADGFVAKVPGGDVGGVNADGIPAGAFNTDVPAGVKSTPVEKTEEQRKADAEADAKVKAHAEDAERRTAAQAKLPTDGSAPDGRAGKDVWVEFLVKSGSRYED